MTSFLANNPTDKNFLSQLGYRFFLHRAPDINFFVQKVNIPGMAIGPIEIPNPFGNVWESGNKLLYNELELTFKVNQSFNNWFEIQNWLIALGGPDSRQAYGELERIPPYTNDSLRSHITLMILDGTRKATVSVTYPDCMPISLSDLIFTSVSNDVEYISATAVFRYSGRYVVETVNAPVEVKPGTTSSF
jgi:hypothetical protein